MTIASPPPVTEAPPGTVLVQLTDLHIGTPGERPYGTDTAANLIRVAETIRHMDLRPAAVLLTGDLTDQGDAESYRHLRRLVDDHLVPLGAPVLAVPGNHDHRGTFRSEYLGVDGDDTRSCHHAVEIDGVRVLMCDSYLAGEIKGALGPDQLEWLDDQLGSLDGRSAVIALHHPSVPRGVPRTDDDLLKDSEAFAGVVSRHRVAAILCGHSHVSTASIFAGALHVTGPATAYLLDPSRRRADRSFDGSGFSICTVREGRAIVNPFILDEADSILSG